MKDRLTVLLLGIIAVALVGVGVIAREKGALALATPGAELHLKSRFGRGLALQFGSQPVAVSARVYRPTSLTLTREQDGSTWQLRSWGPWGQLAEIGVPRGRTTTLEMGPPLQIKPQVEMYPGQVRVGLCLVGRAGEKYENVILRNNQRIPGPRVMIIDDAGTELSSGQFQFG